MKLQLGGLVLLDASFRHTVEPLSQDAALVYPQTEVPMEVGLMKGEVPNTYAVTLRIGIQSPNDRYAISVAYAVPLVVDPEGQELPPDFEHRMLITGASMALPYCREVISNLTSRARFGTVWINPTNFNQIIPPPQQQQVAEATVATE
jgi:preprotein translocase subunit SecB